MGVSYAVKSCHDDELNNDILIAPPGEEWLIWAKGSHDQHQVLHSRLNALEQETASLRQEVSRLLSLETVSVTVQTQGVTDQDGISRQLHSADCLVGGAVPDRMALETHKLPIRQATQPLEEYLGTASALRAVSEKNLLKAFLAGLASHYQRAVLTTALDNTGWTWEGLIREIESLIADEERRAQRRRRLLT